MVSGIVSGYDGLPGVPGKDGYHGAPGPKGDRGHPGYNGAPGVCLHCGLNRVKTCDRKILL